MKIRQLIQQAENILREAGIRDALWDAKLIFFETFGRDSGWLLAHLEDEVPGTAAESRSNGEPEDEVPGTAAESRSNGESEDEVPGTAAESRGNGGPEDDGLKLYNERIKERAKRIPLQHILGHTGFMGLDFKVNEHVLIPRPDTEILVEEALLHIHDGMTLLDMCTGSGCILISLLNYTNDCTGIGVDISEEALKVASDNADTILRSRPEKEFTQYSFLRSDMFSNVPVDMKFDIIVSNPPYIKSNVIESLETEVKDHDPRKALDGGKDGLEFYKILSKESPQYLNSGGYLLMEIGFDQAAEVSELLRGTGTFLDIEVIKDYSGLDRVIKARIPCGL